MKKSLLALPVLAMLAGTAAVGVWQWPVPTPNPDAQSEQFVAPESTRLGDHWRENPKPLPATVESSPAALNVGEETAAEEADLASDLDRIHEALVRVSVDAEGNLVLDELALTSLEQAFDAMGAGATDEAAIRELQQYIEAGLAGETGQQAAAIVGNYFEYRQAVATLESAPVDQGLPNDPRERLEALADLRRSYMGDEVANELFAASQAHKRYLLELQAVRQDNDLSPEARTQKLAELRDDLQSGIFFVDDRDTDAVKRLKAASHDWDQQGISKTTQNYLKQQSLGLVASYKLAETDSQKKDWEDRYNQFESQRSRVVAAGLAEAEKQAQIEDLLRTHFSAKELKAAQGFIPKYLQAEQNQGGSD